jgi:hypothetical protein
MTVFAPSPIEISLNSSDSNPASDRYRSPDVSLNVTRSAAPPRTVQRTSTPPPLQL